MQIVAQVVLNLQNFPIDLTEKEVTNMKYTFVDKAGKQQTVQIPDSYIQETKKNLGFSNKEAIEQFLMEEGYIAPGDDGLFKPKSTEKKRKGPKRKEDPFKRAVIASLFEYLENAEIGEYDIACPAIVNPERIISFTSGEDTYEITLSKKRKSKK